MKFYKFLKYGALLFVLYIVSILVLPFIYPTLYSWFNRPDINKLTECLDLKDPIVIYSDCERTFLGDEYEANFIIDDPKHELFPKILNLLKEKDYTVMSQESDYDIQSMFQIMELPEKYAPFFKNNGDYFYINIPSIVDSGRRQILIHFELYFPKDSPYVLISYCYIGQGDLISAQ